MRAKVWNDNVFPFKQAFKGDIITIPPKSYTEMEFFEANEFRGTYFPMQFNGDGQQIPESYKMIRVEKIDDEKALDKHSCQACGSTQTSKELLEKHIDENHLDQLVSSEVAEKRRGRPRKEVA